MKKIPLLFFILAAQVFAAAFYPATSRFGIYEANTYQGIVGGIPTRSGGNIINATAYGMSTANNGSDNWTGFLAARAACSSGDILYIPAGTYQINGVSLNQDNANITVRGDGPDITILRTASGTLFDIGSSASWSSNYGLTTVSGISRGSTSLTIADASDWPTISGEAQYTLSLILFENEGTTPTITTGNSPQARVMPVLVTARTGTTLTISQPMPSNFTAGVAAGATIVHAVATGQYRNTRGIGIESLTVDGRDSDTMTVGIQFQSATSCWLKDVYIRGATNQGVKIYDSVNVEINKCVITESDGGGTNHTGILAQNVSNLLIVNSVIEDLSPATEFFGGVVNSVIAYNYIGTGLFNTNHAPQNSHNLYEGNVSWTAQNDGYFGGTDCDTFYRSYFRNALVPSLKRFSRQINVIGNLIGVPSPPVGENPSTDGSEHWGTPNIGNNNYTGGTWQLSASDYSLDWEAAASQPYTWTGTLTTRTSDREGVMTLDSGMATSFNAALANTFASNNRRNMTLTNAVGIRRPEVTVLSVSGNNVTFEYASGVAGDNYLPSVSDPLTMEPSQSGFQELDLDVEATTEYKGNWIYFEGSVPASQSLGGDTLVDSYAFPSKPDWFGNLTWPPFTPSSPQATDAAAMVAIPAGWRAINGNENYLGATGNATVTNTTTVTGTLTLP